MIASNDRHRRGRHRRRRGGLASALAIAKPGVGVCARAAPAPWPRDQHAQQRRHSRRHLLPRRLAQGAPVRGGPRAALRLCARHDVPHARCGKFIVATTRARSPRSKLLHALGCQRRAARDGRSRVHPAREPHVPPWPRSVRRTPASSNPRPACARSPRAVRGSAAWPCCGHASWSAPPRRRWHRTADAARDDSRHAASSTPPGCTPMTSSRCSAARRSRSTHAAASTRSSRQRSRYLVNGMVYPVRTRRDTASACISRRRPGERAAGTDRSATRTARTTTRATVCRSRRSSAETRALLPEITLGGSAARRHRHPRQADARRMSRSRTS